MRRLQIDFEDDKLREIDEMVVECGAATKREFFNAALTLFKWAMEQRRKGRVIASIDESKDSYRELEMPLLSNVQIAPL